MLQQAGQRDERRTYHRRGFAGNSWQAAVVAGWAGRVVAGTPAVRVEVEEGEEATALDCTGGVGRSHRRNMYSNSVHPKVNPCEQTSKGSVVVSSFIVRDFASKALIYTALRNIRYTEYRCTKLVTRKGRASKERHGRSEWTAFVP